MYKDTYESTNKGLGFKLTNSMSFGESVISAGNHQGGPIHQTKSRNYSAAYTWEGSRGHHAEAGPERPPGGAGRPHPYVSQSLAMAPSPPSSGIFLHHLLRLHPRCSLSRFDPRAHVGPSRLYKKTPAPLPEA
jgi:hypothetical protein